MRGKLTRMKTSDKSGKTRSDSIEGTFNAYPKNGESFVIFADKKFDGSFGARMWATSPVSRWTCLESDDSFVFWTESGSEYLLDAEPEGSQ